MHRWKRSWTARRPSNPANPLHNRTSGEQTDAGPFSSRRLFLRRPGLLLRPLADFHFERDLARAARDLDRRAGTGRQLADLIAQCGDIRGGLVVDRDDNIAAPESGTLCGPAGYDLADHRAL